MSNRLSIKSKMAVLKWFHPASLYFKFQLCSPPNGWDIDIWKFEENITDRQRTKNREGQTEKPITEVPLITVPIERRIEQANIKCVCETFILAKYLCIESDSWISVTDCYCSYYEPWVVSIVGFKIPTWGDLRDIGKGKCVDKTILSLSNYHLWLC